MRRIALLTIFLAACSGEEPQAQVEANHNETVQESAGESAESVAENSPVTDLQAVTFAPSLAIDLGAMEEQPSGLYIQELREGRGSPAAAGDSMGVAYTVWLPDGSKLDSSFDHTPPDPLPMILGQTRLIAGWTEGVTGMRLGEKRRLVVPYDLAYGTTGRPPRVPPYTPLVFEVELARHSPIGRE